MSETCCIGSCERKVKYKAKGWCGTHYERHRKHGSVEGADRVPGPFEFMESALSSGGAECIEWPYAKAKNGGYGVIAIIGANGHQTVPVTRLMRCIVDGLEYASIKQLPLEVAHAPVICHNPSCINLDHIRWATYSENNMDRVLDGTHRRGSRSPSAKLDEDQVSQIRALSRQGVTAKRIATQFGISRKHVGSIVARKSWKHIE